MTHHTDDDLLTGLFGPLDFADEPPMRSTAHDDARRGRRSLVRRRALTSIAGGVGVAAAATATAVFLPGGVFGDGPAEPETTVLAPPAAEPEADASAGGDGFDYPVTRTSLLQAAQEHLDPAGEHLPASLAEVQNVQGASGDGDASIGTKLGWTIPGDEGLGMIQVAVTTPSYADQALIDFTASLGCDVGTGACAEQTLPGTQLRAWVVENADDAAGVDLAVILERADGSLVGLSAQNLFGNNSVDPVNDVGITLDQAFAFVADPDVVVDADELAATPSGSDGVVLEEGTSIEPTP